MLVTTQKEDDLMASLMKIRRAGQITLAAELRREFGLAEGDYLEGEAVDGGILLKPVSIVEREAARSKLLGVMDRVHTDQPESTQTPEEDEADIVREVKAFRQQHA